MSSLRRLNRSAPLVALAVMLVFPRVLPLPSTDSETSLARSAQVRASFGSVPYRIGDWVVGEAEPVVPVAAVEILHPNVILSRRYMNTGDGRWLSLLIVHCSDARDMQGHYPPNCYPANGWTLDAQRDCSVPLQGQEIEMRIYDFRRMRGWANEERLRVFNYFMLPNGDTALAMSAVKRLAGRYSTSVQGVAQVQLMASEDLSVEDSIEAIAELLDGLMPHLHVLQTKGVNK